MTISQIRSIGFSKELKTVLDEKFSDDEAVQLSTTTGVLLGKKEGVYNACLKWEKDDTTGSIKGVFLRIFNASCLAAWNSLEEKILFIRNKETYVLNRHDLPVIIEEILKGQKVSDSAPEFQIEQMEKTEVIEKFFEKYPDMLPDSIRACVFPSLQQDLVDPVLDPVDPVLDPVDPIPEREQNINRFYVVGGTLGIFLIAYVALKVFNRTHKPLQPTQV